MLAATIPEVKPPATVLLLPSGLNLFRHPGSHKLFWCAVLLDQRGRRASPVRKIKVRLVHNAGPVTAPGKTKFLADLCRAPEVPLAVVVGIIGDLAVPVDVHAKIKVKGDTPLML